MRSRDGTSATWTSIHVQRLAVVRLAYCGVCQMWFGKFMEEKRARETHCRADPGHVSRAAHAQQLQRKQLSRAKTKATGRAQESCENAS
jgi:hypothetical protein